MDDLVGLETPVVGVHLDEPLMTANEVARLLAVPRSSPLDQTSSRYQVTSCAWARAATLKITGSDSLVLYENVRCPPAGTAVGRPASISTAKDFVDTLPPHPTPIT